ncbi:hypothetical protein ABT389_25395 [Streptomyces bacillaris]|uniref:hypothetical protein n=1 Tax=Streptomyces bacillaris TaxID=68179 RepID=UPI0033646D97
MKIYPKVGVPAITAVAVAGIAFAAVSTHSKESARESEGRAPQKIQAFSEKLPAPQIGDEGNPATWKLPIEFYFPGRSGTLKVSNARDIMIDACMANAGYEAWQPAPDLPSIDGTSFTDRRYGIHNPDLTSQRGYHPDLALQDSYDEAMRIGAVDKSGADPAALRVCVQEADGQVPEIEVDAIVQRIDNDSFVASLKDDSVIKVFGDWSACMKRAGFTYENPLEALNDSRFGDSRTVTNLEISTATADLKCRNQHKVTRTWFDAEAKIQQLKISEHLTALNAAKSRSASAVAKASAFLAQNT